MVYIDVPKVKGKMAERGYSITSLAKTLGINRNTLSVYLETPGKTPYCIVASMATLLCNSAEEATSIFFAQDLRNTKVCAAS